MSNEQKPGDPADKGADQFQPTVSHRAGYGDDKLERLIAYLRRQPRATLASGEGALLLAEIDRLREERDDALIDRRFSDEQRAKWMAENVSLLQRADRAERILAALREPSEAVVGSAWQSFQLITSTDEYGRLIPQQYHYIDSVFRDDIERAIRAAVAAAEQEVGRE